MSDEPLSEVYWLGPMRIVRRPVEIPPPPDVLCIVDDMSRARIGKLGAARYTAGKWIDTNGQPIEWSPTHWTLPEP